MAENMNEELPMISPSISKESIISTCKKLSRAVREPSDTENEIVTSVYGLAKTMLEDDETLKLASRVEFNKKVEAYPKEAFMDRLKGLATEDSVASWSRFLKDDVLYATQNENPPNMYVTESSVHASVRAWRSTFKGHAAEALFNSISDLLNPAARAYARSTCVINSSGTGKSRMVDELSMSIIVVPICLRPHGSQGFPPPDINLRKYLQEIGRPRDQGLVKQALHGVVYGILTATLTQLESFPCDITLPEDGNADKYAELAIERQRQLASAFRDFMTVGQSFGKVNNDRQEFYAKVIEAAKTFNGQCHLASETQNSPAQYVDTEGKGVRTAGKLLTNFVDPRGYLKTPEWRRPLIIMSFDEPHVLMDGEKEGEWSSFSELRRILQRLDNYFVFSLFLSTAGNFRFLSPDIKSDPSSRVLNNRLLPFHPITEISFDCIAYPAVEYEISLYRVIQVDWIAHLGRPLFGSHFNGLPEEDREVDIIRFAKQKLLNSGNDYLEPEDSSGSLACLAIRFGLEFNEDEDSCNVSFKQVERHMRICIAATTGFKKLITCSSSEPLLAEAAFDLMSHTTSSPVKYLANHANLYCVDRGRRGELVAALIVMQARDAALPMEIHQRRWVSVTEFIEALLPPQKSKEYLDSLPRHWREGEEDITFRQMFTNCRMWINHAIKVEDSDVIRPEFLWKFVTRGAMVVCKDNQQGIDIILPVVWMEGNLSRRTVSSIVIQVKNSKEFGLDIKKKLFDAMDPCKLGILADHPRPTIRMVFALASPEAGICFPPRRSHADKFTSYDIWCGGMSTETFRQTGEDIDSYQKLLDRSQRSHDAFDVSDSPNPLSQNTKMIVGRIRRSMAPLVKYEGHDGIHGSAGHAG